MPPHSAVFSHICTPCIHTARYRIHALILNSHRRCSTSTRPTRTRWARAAASVWRSCPSAVGSSSSTRGACCTKCCRTALAARASPSRAGLAANGAPRSLLELAASSRGRSISSLVCLRKKVTRQGVRFLVTPTHMSHRKHVRLRALRTSVRHFAIQRTANNCEHRTKPAVQCRSSLSGVRICKPSCKNTPFSALLLTAFMAAPPHPRPHRRAAPACF